MTGHSKTARVSNIFLASALALMTSHCALLSNQDDPKPDTKSTAAKPAVEEEEKDENVMDPNAIDALELKQANLWARVDELERTVLKQREKISLLERGMLLGVTPKALQNPAKQKNVAAVDTKDASEDAPVAKVARPAPEDNKTETVNKDKEAYNKRIVAARDMYKEGHFGQAYIEFSKLEKEFDPAVTGNEPQYWIGRSWIKLKEYRNAKQVLENYIAKHADSPWAPSAKYFLAEAEIQLGLNENAIKRLQEVIRDHPYEDSAEAAKQLLASVQRGL